MKNEEEDRISEPLPVFKYMPDPIAAESVVESHTKCVCCGRARGYIYVGPVYSIETLDDCICPWCISDGSAHEKFDASFTDRDGIGQSASKEIWDAVAEEVLDEIEFRTPGFNGLQQERWWTHCNDGAAFIEVGGLEEIMSKGEKLEEYFRNHLRNNGCPEQDIDNYLKILDKNTSPIACIFRCRRCGKYGGYLDVD